MLFVQNCMILVYTNSGLLQPNLNARCIAEKSKINAPCVKKFSLNFKAKVCFEGNKPTQSVCSREQC
jgi:hypothetical protein